MELMLESEQLTSPASETQREEQTAGHLCRPLLTCMWFIWSTKQDVSQNNHLYLHFSFGETLQASKPSLWTFQTSRHVITMRSQLARCDLRKKNNHFHPSLLW